MKKILAILLTLALCFQLFGMVTSADGGVISVSSVSGDRGQPVTVYVSISGNPGVAGLVVDVTFDSNVLTFDSASDAGLLPGYTSSNTSNSVRFLWQNASDSYGNGTIGSITFTIKETAAIGPSAISVSVVDSSNQSEEDVSFGAASGSITVNAPVCDHVWGEWGVTTPATCTEKGEETRKCACGAEEHRDIDPTGHTFGEWTVTTPATCTEKGEETRKCACGAEEHRDIDPTGHTFGEWVVTAPATCTEKGEETRKCACGAGEHRDIDPTGHTFGEWTVTTPATCTEKGEETRKCACGAEEHRDIDPTGHTLTHYGKDATFHWLLCDDCDYTGQKAPHTFNYSGVCVCGATKPVVKDPNLDDVPKTGDLSHSLKNDSFPKVLYFTLF